MKLDELNELLRKEAPDLPPYRLSVNKSGSNLHWLRKNLSDKVSPQLKELLALDIGRLLRD